MKDERDSPSGTTATAELETETKQHDEVSHEERRHTTAGLGTYERISSVAGSTSGFGMAPGLGAATPNVRTVETAPGITGVSRDYSPGEPGTTHETRFTEEEDAYWRESYASRPYARSNSTYDEYRPAYQYGTDAAHRYQGRRWEDVEGHLERGWDEARSSSASAWHNIKEAVRDAWHRVERTLSGDAGRNSR